MLLLAVVAELAVLTSCQLLPLTVESSLCSIKRENDCECYEDKIRINKVYCKGKLGVKLHLDELVVDCDEVTFTKLISYLADLNLAKLPAVDIVKFQNCPLPDKHQNYDRLLRQGGLHRARRMVVEGAHADGRLIPAHLVGLNHLRTLVLRNASVRLVNRSFFENVPNLKFLDLSSNQGLTFGANSLADLTKLENLRIANCNLSNLPENLFTPLRKLKKLSLFTNQIAEIPPSLFKTNRHLEEINLTKNKLNELPRRIFDNMPNLTEISLSMNEWQRFRPKLFSQNRRLRLVELKMNGPCPHIHPTCRESELLR